jgi:hypothetical protein
MWPARQDEKCVQNLFVKPERKRLLGRPKRRPKVNIKINLREIDFEGVDGIHMAQDTASSGPLNIWQ